MKKIQVIKSNAKHKIIYLCSLCSFMFNYYLCATTKAQFKNGSDERHTGKLLARTIWLEGIIVEVMPLSRQLPLMSTCALLIEGCGFEERLERWKKIATEHKHLQYNIARENTVVGDTEICSLAQTALLSLLSFWSSSHSQVGIGNICKQNRLLVLLGFTPKLLRMLSSLPNSMCLLCHIFPHDCSLLFTAPTHWLPW